MVSIASMSSVKIPVVTTGLVENVVIAAANVEQAYTFPNNTKNFQVQARETGKIKLSFDPGMSGSEYYTIYPGAFYTQGNIGVESLTIYFQSPTAGLSVELVSWS